MAVLQENKIKLIIAFILITIQLTKSAKTNSTPVYEVINEQSKAEDTLIKTSEVANIPYGNPLAGNSQQNAKLHAHNQQAMFNAERVRQHRAQLQQQQQWMKTKLVHNYMRNYQETEDIHQLELEQQAERNKERFKEAKKTKDKDLKLETGKTERKRIHRSHGSVDYQTVYIPLTKEEPTFNEMTQTSNTEPIYSQSESYQVQDVEILNSLLNKNPNEQLTEFNALLNKPAFINHDKELELPINLHFDIKGPSKFHLPIHYNTRYAQIPVVREPHKYIHNEPKYIEPVTKNIQYINTELTNHVVTAYNPLQEYKQPKYEALHYVPIYQNVYKTEDMRQGLHENTQDDAGVAGHENLNYAASYEFGYKVHDMHSGNDFGHQEEKSGEETNGKYHVLLPDGRMQSVRYTAGPEGFHADISYDGRT